MKSVASLALFLLRHGIAVPVIAILLCLLCALVYFALLFFAMATNSGIGGPLTLPAGLILICVLCAVIGWGIFTPACAVGYFLHRVLRIPAIAAIPFVWITMCGLCSGFYWLYAFIAHPDNRFSVGIVFLHSALYLSLPLGFYWWITEGPAAVWDLGKRLWKQSKNKKSEPAG